MNDIIVGKKYLYVESREKCLVIVDNVKEIIEPTIYYPYGHVHIFLHKITNDENSDLFPETWDVKVTMGMGSGMCPWQLREIE